MIEHCGNGDACRARRREAISAGGDGGKGDRGEAVSHRKPEAIRVAGRKQQILVAHTSAPDGTHCVDHVTGRQAEAWRDLRLPGLAAAKRGTSRAELGPGGAVNRTVDSPAAKQCSVGGVDNGIKVECRDVAFDNVDAVSHAPWETPGALGASTTMRGRARRRWRRCAGNAPRSNLLQHLPAPQASRPGGEYAPHWHRASRLGGGDGQDLG